MQDRSGIVQGTPLFERYCRNQSSYELAKVNTMARIERRGVERDALREVLDADASIWHANFLRGMYSRSDRPFPSVAQCDLVRSKGRKRMSIPSTSSLLWVEPVSPLPTQLGRVAGFFFYDPESQYKIWSKGFTGQEKYYRSVSHRILGGDPGWSSLRVIDGNGSVLMDIECSADKNKWRLAYPHVCAHSCQYMKVEGEVRPHLHTCIICAKAFDYITMWFGTYYTLHTTGEIDLPEPEEPIKKEKPAKTPKKKQRTKWIIEPSTRFYKTFPEPIPPKLPTQSARPTRPYIATHPLLFERSLAKNQALAGSLLHAHKYLWMNSAWAMAEYLCQSEDERPLQVPPDPVFIELEQPREMYGQVVAAFSLLSVGESRWKLSVLHSTGETVWSVLYEHSQWVLSQNYVCPEGKCSKIITPDGVQFELCPLCQERFIHYTSWIAAALRMVAGDYQEHVELREPLYVTEMVGDIIYRYRVIRYLDACSYRGVVHRTLRGSWMTGRPFARGEYEVNPNAIIYVQMPIREHDRTFSAERYVNMKGKTTHVDALYRLQPMTIATYRQLEKPRLVTHVIASLFE